MDASILQAVVDIVGNMPEGPYITFESPFPAMEQITNGGDTNFGSTFGDLNVGSTDILDIDASTHNETNISGADVG